jgi:hypothetical protein
MSSKTVYGLLKEVMHDIQDQEFYVAELKLDIVLNALETDSNIYKLVRE